MNWNFRFRNEIFTLLVYSSTTGIICTEGQLWKDQRNLVQKWLKDIGMVKYGAKRVALEARIMDGVERSIKEFNDKIQDLNDIKINPVEILNHNFGNVVNDLVFGVKYDRDDETWNYLQYLQEEGVKYIGICGAVNFLPILRFLPSNKKVMNFLMTGIVKTHKIYDNIINNCQNKLDEPQKTSTDQQECILRYFLMERQFRVQQQDEKLMNCSQKQLRFLLADIYGASFDTTFTTLRWFLYFVAKNYHVQKRLYQEMEIFGKDGIISLDILENMPYFKATVAEVLRIRSVVPAGIPHGTNKDSKLCGYHIPKNSMVCFINKINNLNN